MYREVGSAVRFPSDRYAAGDLRIDLLNAAGGGKGVRRSQDGAVGIAFLRRGGNQHRNGGVFRIPVDFTGLKRREREKIHADDPQFRFRVLPFGHITGDGLILRIFSFDADSGIGK